jgi:hypothetical protein
MLKLWFSVVASLVATFAAAAAPGNANVDGRVVEGQVATDQVMWVPKDGNVTFNAVMNVGPRTYPVSIPGSVATAKNHSRLVGYVLTSGSQGATFHWYTIGADGEPGIPIRCLKYLGSTGGSCAQILISKGTGLFLLRVTG